MPNEEVDLSLVFEDIYSLTNYDEGQYNYVLDWIAQMFRFPHILPGIFLIFISDEGVGKDKFLEFLSNVINPEYYFNTEKLESICGKFNHMLGGKLLIAINETNPIESRQHIDNIKYITTANEVIIEGKHKDPIKSRNFARFIFASNRVFAVPIEHGACRPNVINYSSKYLPAHYGMEESHQHFAKLMMQCKINVFKRPF